MARLNFLGFADAVEYLPTCWAGAKTALERHNWMNVSNTYHTHMGYCKVFQAPPQWAVHCAIFIQTFSPTNTSFLSLCLFLTIFVQVFPQCRVFAIFTWIFLTLMTHSYWLILYDSFASMTHTNSFIYDSLVLMTHTDSLWLIMSHFLMTLF